MGLSPLLEEFVEEVQNFTKCSAVGIRLLDKEGNIPYQAYAGFSKKFYNSENPLSIKSDQCMCINVITKKTDPRLPYFTKKGSFYTNSTTKLLATVPEDQKGKTRNVCNREGYETVALIPIFLGSTLFGIIHIADAKENAIHLETVSILEKAALQLGAAINRARMENNLQEALNKSQRRETEISALLKSSQAVMESQNFEKTARAIFNSCKELIGATAGYVALLSDNGKENEVLFLDSGGLSCAVDPNLQMPIRGLRAEAYRTGQAVFHNDFTKSDWVKYMPEGHVIIKNVLFAPLVIEKKVVGLLGLANNPKDFTENDARMAKAFGELVSIALCNSRNLELLENSEKRFRSVVETANDAIISISSKGNVIFWNNGAKNIFGYSANEIVGKPLTKIIPASLHSAHKEGLNRATATEKSKIIGKKVEITGLRKDHSEFYMELSIARWRAGVGTFFTGIIRDITERKLVENELKNHREQLMELVEERTSELQKINEELEKEIAERKQAEQKVKHMALFAELNPSPVLRFDINGKVLMANPSAAEILGNNSLIGTHLTSIIPGIEEFNHAEFIRNGSILSHSAQIGARFFHFIFRGISHLGIGQIYGSDITERRHAEEEAMRASHLAALGELAAGVAHEINNPVNGIINYTQILTNISKPGSKGHDIALRIIKEGDRIANIVRSLLSFARDSKEEKYPVSIEDIMSDSLALTQTQMKKDGIKLKVNFFSAIPKIIAQPQQIEQVFLNIISNARYALNDKYPGSHEDKIFEIISEEVIIDNCPYIQMTFYDKGQGIPAEIMDKVMNPFFTTKPSNIGTGLGLSISHGIISDHGGRISIESTEGEFTKIIIDLPVSNYCNTKIKKENMREKL